MKTRRHHNNKGLRQIKRGKTREQVAAMAERLGVRRRPLFEQWATMAKPDQFSDERPRVCLWGDQGSAMEGCDPDEVVCLVRVEVLEVLD